MYTVSNRVALVWNAFIGGMIIPFSGSSSSSFSNGFLMSPSRCINSPAHSLLSSLTVSGKQFLHRSLTRKKSVHLVEMSYEMEKREKTKKKLGSR